MRRSCQAVMALAFFASCTGGPKGEPGATGSKGDIGNAGPQGDPGPVGPKGDLGMTGPAGPTGAVSVLSAADGSTVTIDGGVVIISGQPGQQGPVGASGPAGPIGSTGPAGATGPTGPTGAIGPIGPGAGVLVVGADGGVQGVLAGKVFYDTQAHCGIDVNVGEPRVQLCWTNPDCTGTPYVLGLSYVDGTLISPSLVGLCFFGNGNQSLGGYFRLSEPIQRVPTQLWSCYRHNQNICDLQTTPATSAYAVVRLSLPAPSFPPADGFTLQFP